MHLRKFYLEDYLLQNGDAKSEDTRVWTDECYRTSKMNSRTCNCSFRWIWQLKSEQCKVSGSYRGGKCEHCFDQSISDYFTSKF